MFDDPKKELNRLDAELRAESYEEELEQLQSQEIPALDDLFEYEDDGWLGDPEETEDADIPIRNHANAYGRKHSDAPDFRRTVYADESSKENDAVFVEKQGKSKQKDKRKDGVGCLPFVILLELMGIAGMLWWWYRWMR